MTTLLEQYAVWWPVRCGPAVALTNGKTATQIYNGPDRPEFWLASYGMVDMADSQRVLVILLKDAAINLSVSSLKTRIDGLRESDDGATLIAHRLWCKNRIKAKTVENDLERAFYTMVCFLLKGSPKSAPIPFELIVTYLMEVLSKDVTTVRTSMYETLRAEVTEEMWKGPYT